MSAELSILLAEDDETDVFLMRRAFKEVNVENALNVARDGQEAIDFLSQQRQNDQDRMPALVVLDLKMPRKNGFDVLQWIRAQPVLRCLPVIIFSSSSRGQDIESSYALGANAFIVKPSSTIQRKEVARFFKEWMQFARPPLAVSEGYRAAQAAHSAHPFDSSTLLS